MSQVRKYQDGGNAPEIKKEEIVVEQPATSVVPGLEAVILKPTEVEPVNTKPKSYLIWDGEKIENTDENRQIFLNFLAVTANENGGSQILSQIGRMAQEAVEKGWSLKYDTPSNELYYLDENGNNQYVNWEVLNDRQDKRLQKDRSRLGRFFDANSNSKVQRAAKDIYKLRGFRNYWNSNSTTSTAAVDPDLINIGWGGDRFFEYLKNKDGIYEKDENGNLKYDRNSAVNQNLMQILNRINTYLGLQTDDERNQFKLVDEWNTDGRFDALKGIYSSDPTTWKSNYDSIINKVVTGQQLSPEDISWLKLFGFNPNGPAKTPEELAAEKTALIKTNWTNAGFGDLYDKGKNWFDLGDDNILTLNDTGRSILGNYIMDSSGNEFNDEWLKYLGTKGANVSDFDWLNGYTLYNGRLYKTSSAADPNSALGKIYNTSGFVSKNRENAYAEAQKIINTFWGNPYEWESPDEAMYSSFTWDPSANNGQGGYRTNRRFRNETGRYSGIGKNQQLVSYYDPDAERDYRGMWTDAGQRFAITDENGDVIADGLTIADLEKRGIKKIYDSAGNEIPYDPNRAFKQRGLYKSDDVRINNHTGIFFGDNRQIALYFNPMRSPNGSDPTSHVLFTMPGLDAAYVVPATLAKKLLAKDANGVRGIEKIIADSRFQEILKNVLEKIGQGKFLSGGDANRNKLAEILGMNEAETQQFIAECNSMANDTKVNRKTKWKVSVDSINAAMPKSQVASQKHGGTIRKFAPGGGFAKTSGSTASTTQIKTKVQDYRKSQSPFESGHWTAADTADMIGLGLDISAIAAGSVPVAGGALGLAGTGSGLYADIKRDGFQWGDLGSAALSGTMDVVSMIPGLGSGVQAAKVLSKIKKFAKPAITLLSVAGAYNAATIIEKIIKGEKPTMQEWRILANGFAAGINVAKLGGPGKPTKKGAFKDIDITAKGQQEVGAFNIKPKTGEDLPEINLTKSQIDEINAITDPALKKQKIGRYVQAALQGDARTQGKPIKDFLDKYDLNSFTESATSPASGITVKSRVKGEDDIVLTKSDVDEINAQPDAASKMAKAREKIAYYRGLSKPAASATENAAAASKYNLGNLWKVKSNIALNGKIKVNRPDITLDKNDIETISKKTSPAEQQKAFVDIIKSKSGDDSLDSIDKIKDSFKVDDFFELKRGGNWEWKHPIESIKNKFKKKDTFVLKAERVEEARPIRGNNALGLGFRDWWNSTGTYRNNGTNRSDLFNFNSRPAPASPTSGTSGGTRTATNLSSGFAKLFTPKNQRGLLVMQPGNSPWLRIHNYTADEAPGVIEDENGDMPGMFGAFSYKKGGLIPKAEGGAKTEVTTEQNHPSGGLTEESIKDKLKNIKVDPASILEFGSLVGAITANNNLKKILNKGLENPPMVIAPQYNIPRFDDNGILNEGRQLVKEIYNRQPANYTSDAMLNNFIRKANQEKATEYQYKINNAFSQQLAKHRAAMEEIRNKNIANQVEATNKNRQTIYANQNAIAKNNAATQISNWQSIDNFVKGKISNLAKQKAQATALKDSLNSAMINAKLAADPDYQNVQNAYKEFAKTNPTISFETWLSTAGKDYQLKYNQAINKAQLESIKSQIADANLGWYNNDVRNYYDKTVDKAKEAKMISKKSGGKISKSNYKAYRDYKEQLVIDSNKEVRKAIAQLGKDCQQLLLKMLK